MANTRLYEKWTWNIGLPEPFDKAAHTKSSTDKSKYNTTTTVATYHGPVLQALMEYMEMDTTISCLLIILMWFSVSRQSNKLDLLLPQIVYFVWK